MHNKLFVIIPSRKGDMQLAFIERAIASVRNQTFAHKFEIHIFIGVDRGCALDASVADNLSVSFIESKGNSQAAALNGAIRHIGDGFVAFLEDDDQWMPEFLECATQAIGLAEFISSTQMELDEKNELLKINDFPTPSGWFMSCETLKKVGEFNEDYRFHLDNEWLGRLDELKIQRIHMVESTAPTDIQFTLDSRPILFNILNSTKGLCRLIRHQSPYPLVKRLVHSKSGMASIFSNPELLAISQEEFQRLSKRFGKLPC